MPLLPVKYRRHIMSNIKILELTQNDSNQVNELTDAESSAVYGGASMAQTSQNYGGIATRASREIVTNSSGGIAARGTGTNSSGGIAARGTGTNSSGGIAARGTGMNSSGGIAARG
jgi:hypothetical protein